ncbi:MAG: hypothetical protein JNL52_06060 [Flavobacteriales bacterium]|nr:hypothetical protein [Flavobacteriales bacterium]
MKRTPLLLLTLVLMLCPFLGKAQGPLPVRVDASLAAQFIQAHPEHARAFAFDKSSGSANCSDAAALAAFDKFKKDLPTLTLEQVSGQTATGNNSAPIPADPSGEPHGDPAGPSSPNGPQSASLNTGAAESNSMAPLSGTATLKVESVDPTSVVVEVERASAYGVQATDRPTHEQPK